jgi:predicted RNA-binding protein with PUA-like domain
MVRQNISKETQVFSHASAREVSKVQSFARCKRRKQSSRVSASRLTKIQESQPYFDSKEKLRSPRWEMTFYHSCKASKPCIFFPSFKSLDFLFYEYLL